MNNLKTLISTLWLTLCVVVAAPSSYAFDCEKYEQEIQTKQTKIPADMSGRKVVGKGRLYFYTAPDERCRSKVFVIPGDLLDAYAEYKKYSSVLYLNPKTKVEATGWVETHRLGETGSGVGPSP